MDVGSEVCDLVELQPEKVIMRLFLALLFAVPASGLSEVDEARHELHRPSYTQDLTPASLEP